MKSAPALAVLAASALLAGCSIVDDGEQGRSAGTAFPAGAVADYQLGGAYAPPPGTELVVRDATAEPAPGVYSICYINGFQTQPGADWPDELLLHENGRAIVDPDWPDEHILDIADGYRRAEILERLAPTVTGCAEDGFQAVEFDNLDTYTRFGDHLAEAHTIAFATRLVALAHEVGLAAGQKNTAELAAAGRDQIGFDFAITEECDRYEECDEYTEVYGERVLAVEYTDAQRREFGQVCADPARPATVVLRDRDLVTPDVAAYHHEHC